MLRKFYIFWFYYNTLTIIPYLVLFIFQKVMLILTLGVIFVMERFYVTAQLMALIAHNAQGLTAANGVMALNIKKRPWRLYPKRIVEEANIASGLSGLAGGAITAAGVVIAAPFVMAAGSVVTVGVIGWCLYRAIPVAHLSPGDISGKVIHDLNELNNIDPILERVGFIGPGRVGKSTLLSHVAAQTPPNNVSTSNVYAFVTAVSGGPALYFALMDGAGQMYAQQFDIIAQSDKIIMFLDHAPEEGGPTKDNTRLQENENFLKQILGLLVAQKRSNLTVHFIMNKRDQWENGADHNYLSTWFEMQVQAWKSIPSFNVTSDIHSNYKTSDLTKIIQLLRSWSK